MSDNTKSTASSIISKTSILEKFKSVRESTKSLANDMFTIKQEYLGHSLYAQYAEHIENKFSEDERGLRIVTRSLDLLIKKIEPMDEQIKTEDFEIIRKKFSELVKTLNGHTRDAERFFKEMSKINKSIKDSLDDEY